MKATDFRDATFEGLRAELPALRLAAYFGWMTHGPGTTREVAGRCGMDILTFRPRTTELVQMGLVRVQNEECRMKNGEGVYRAAMAEEWEDWKRGMVSGQQMLI